MSLFVGRLGLLLLFVMIIYGLIYLPLHDSAVAKNKCLVKCAPYYGKVFIEEKCLCDLGYEIK